MSARGSCCDRREQARQRRVGTGPRGGLDAPIYHAAVALLLTEGLEPRSHAGTASLLGLHFVKTGRMGPEDARLFARIQKYRLEADYGRDFVLTEAALREDLVSCQGFLDRVREITAAFLGSAAGGPRST